MITNEVPFITMLYLLDTVFSHEATFAEVEFRLEGTPYMVRRYTALADMFVIFKNERLYLRIEFRPAENGITYASLQFMDIFSISTLDVVPSIHMKEGDKFSITSPEMHFQLSTLYEIPTYDELLKCCNAEVLKSYSEQQSELVLYLYKNNSDDSESSERIDVHELHSVVQEAVKTYIGSKKNDY